MVQTVHTYKPFWGFQAHLDVMILIQPRKNNGMCHTTLSMFLVFKAFKRLLSNSYDPVVFVPVSGEHNMYFLEVGCTKDFRTLIHEY